MRFAAPILWTIRFCAAVSAAALAACAPNTPADLMVAKAEDANFGYVQKTLSDTSYEIAYYGPEIYTQITVRSWLDDIAKTAQKTSHDLALWRASQIAITKGYKAFTVTSDKEAVRHYIIGRDYENVPVSTFESVTIRKLEYYSATYFRGEAVLTIELADENAEGAINAEATVAQMSGYYPRAVTEAIMPDTNYYFGPASWLYGYGEKGTEEPLFSTSKAAPKPPERKPLGQPYYAP